MSHKTSALRRLIHQDRDAIRADRAERFAALTTTRRDFAFDLEWLIKRPNAGAGLWSTIHREFGLPPSEVFAWVPDWNWVAGRDLSWFLKHPWEQDADDERAWRGKKPLPNEWPEAEWHEQRSWRYPCPS